MRTINEPVEAILDVTKITKAIVSIGVKKEKTDISFIPITITEDMSEKNARKSAYLIPLNFCPEIVITAIRIIKFSIYVAPISIKG
jgi:hypothetical protein